MPLSNNSLSVSAIKDNFVKLFFQDTHTKAVVLPDAFLNYFTLKENEKKNCEKVHCKLSLKLIELIIQYCETSGVFTVVFV